MPIRTSPDPSNQLLPSLPHSVQLDLPSTLTSWKFTSCLAPRQPTRSPPRSDLGFPRPASPHGPLPHPPTKMDRIKSLLPSRHGYTRSRVDSDLSFTDARPPNFAVPLTPPPNQIFSLAGAGQASGAGYGHGSEAGPSSSTGLSTGFGSHRRVGSGGGPVRMNASEQARLQGLMRRERTASLLSVGGSVRGIGEGEMGRGGIQGRWEKLQVWMVNEGKETQSTR